MAKQENIKLTEEEITSINTLKVRQESLNSELKQIAFTELNISIRKDELKDYLKQNKEIEAQIGQTLMTKYGNGSIDIESGCFVPFHK